MITLDLRWLLELKRLEGTSIYVTSGKKFCFLKDKKFIRLFCFSVAMFLLSFYIYVFPMGEVDNSLDYSFHMVTCFIPIVFLLFALRFDLFKSRGV